MTIDPTGSVASSGNGMRSRGAFAAAEPVILVIADISGYTRYMTANAKTLSHSHVIITELVEALVQEVQVPLEIAKLEGDAIFMFCRKEHPTHSWSETCRTITAQLLLLFRKFSGKLRELAESTHCACSACMHIEKLRLKIIVHSGEALFHRLAGFIELAGVDVILVHRLLKNSVDADQYLLLTEGAHCDLSFPEAIAFVRGSETYDDIGLVRTMVHIPGPKDDRVDDPPQEHELIDLPETGEVADTLPFGKRFVRNWRLYWKLWFAPLVLRAEGHHGHYHHVTGSVSVVQRAGLALLTLLLTPLMVPVSVPVVLSQSVPVPGRKDSDV